MDKETLEKLIERYEAKALKASDNYQQTGDPRYDREYRKNDDLAEALRMSLNAADEHKKLSLLKSQICYWPFEADKGNDIRKEVLSYAESQGYYISKGKA